MRAADSHGGRHNNGMHPTADTPALMRVETKRGCIGSGED